MRIFSLLTLVLPVSLNAALSVGIFSYNETCGQQNGMLVAYVSGGVAPYALLWSNASTNDTIEGLNDGWYSVQVTDNVGTVVTEQAYVNDGPLNVSQAGWTWSGGLPCPGQCNGGFSIPLEGINGQQPYSFGLNTGVVADPSYPHPLFTGFCDMDAVSLTVIDGTGCSGVLEIIFNGPNGDPIQVTNINGACNGQPNGSVLLLMPQEDAIDPNYYVYVRNGGGQSVGGYNGTGPAQVLVSNLAPGVYTIERTYSGTLDGCLDVSSFVIPAISECGTVSGDNWYDVDADCIRDGGEVGIPYRILEVQPGPEYAITSGIGHYSYNLQNGNYTLAQTDATLIPICPVVQPAPFTLNDNAAVIDLPDGSTVPLDLVVSGAQGNAVPGFAYALYAQVTNPTPQASGPVTVTCTFDPALTYTNASPPASVLGNVITWSLPPLGSFGAHQVSVELSVPVGTPLGTVLNNSFDATNTLLESDPVNNVIGITTTVIGSYDPNDKTARTNSGWSDELYYIDVDEWVDYTIRFQNTGTAAATFVVVTDTLSAALDMLTFEQGTASHPFEVTFKPGRVVEWRFENINLPDSASDEAASHGLVSFRIRPVTPLLAGTVIENIANIFFDFNPPVITEPSVLVAEFSTGVEQQESNAISLAPVPANDELIVSSGEALANVRILAADGREVMRMSARSTHVRIDLNALKSGAYLLIAELDSGTTARERFIKH